MNLAQNRRWQRSLEQRKIRELRRHRIERTKERRERVIAEAIRAHPKQVGPKVPTAQTVADTE